MIKLSIQIFNKVASDFNTVNTCLRFCIFNLEQFFLTCGVCYDKKMHAINNLTTTIYKASVGGQADQGELLRRNCERTKERPGQE